jgi:hypothetical protein
MSYIELIAKTCHEANRAYCQSIGDHSQPEWNDAPEWQRESAVNGVRFHLENPDATPENSHENWLRQKESEGWKYGPVKNPETKEHPCFCMYHDLPIEQRSKDYIFRSIVHSMAPVVHATAVGETKQFRKDLDEVLQRIKLSSIPGGPTPCRASRERSLAVTKLQESIMWLGMDLKEMAEPSPYPNSYNPESPVIDKTADGLKL